MARKEWAVRAIAEWLLSNGVGVLGQSIFWAEPVGQADAAAVYLVFAALVPHGWFSRQRAARLRRARAEAGSDTVPTG
ncbi:hypothetical protein ACOQFL_12145 [Actinopolyspora sp. H202]|uniref:hypothetical protein n=1 Tax=Actinopolyspora sp. H202 TaxID=1500456 RepID=UPI003EE6DA0F